MKLPILAAIVAFLVIAYVAASQHQTSNTAGPNNGLRSISANKEDTRDLSILFIGNSYTFFNDMPGMLLEVAANDPENMYNISVQSIVQGGAKLKDHWENKNTHTILDQQKWDIIVLQEQSMWALFRKNIRNAREYTAHFVRKAKEKGAKVVIFQTWPRQPGSHWYTSRKHSQHTKSPDYMFKMITLNTAQLAKENGVIYAPVGIYWHAMALRNKEINLYNPDGTHPSAAGSYLTALVFYKYLTGQAPNRTQYQPNGIPAEQAETIKRHIMKDL